jgi:hypothetical protein
VRGSSLPTFALVMLVAACAPPASVPSATTNSGPAPVATAPVAVTHGAIFAVARGDGVATVRIREQLVGWTVPDDAILTSDDVSGTFGLLDDGTFDPASSLSISLMTIKSDESLRAEAARETMNAYRFPLAEFRPLRTSGLPTPLPATGRWDFRITGTLSVNGISRDLDWDASAERTGGEIKATAKTSFRFGDFAMDVPRRGPVLSIVDEIRLQVDVTARPGGTLSTTCTATPQDAAANYQPNAPVRSTIGGGGYAFSGVVRSTAGCRAIAAARVELWHANPRGEYDDDHRATVITDAVGGFRLDTTFPAAYGGGRSHIHIRVTAAGHRELVSVFFPQSGSTSGEMTLVMERL